MTDLNELVCKKCKKLIKRSDLGYCPSCRRSIMDMNAQISDYLEKNPNSCIADIVSAIGVSVKNVNDFMSLGGASFPNQKESWEAPRKVEDLSETNLKFHGSKMSTFGRRR